MPLTRPSPHRGEGTEGVIVEPFLRRLTPFSLPVGGSCSYTLKSRLRACTPGPEPERQQIANANLRTTSQPMDSSEQTAMADGGSGDMEHPQPTDPGTMATRLYVVPLILVVILVGGWMFTYGLLHEEQDAQSLVRGMQEPGRRSWQRAYALSQLLQDPAHDNLKDDPSLCRELVAILRRQNQQVAGNLAAGNDDEEHARFRMYLCRAVGQFRLPDGLPALLTAAQADSGPHAPPVRAAALEGIAILAANIGSEPILDDPAALSVVIDATGDATLENETLVATAAYTLGVLGGPTALNRLAQLVDDPRDSVRYNAATGLARHGDERGASVLLEMLASASPASTGQAASTGPLQQRQLIVIRSGIQAAERLCDTASPAVRQELIGALQTLINSPHAPAPTRLLAKETLLKLEIR